MSLSLKKCLVLTTLVVALDIISSNHEIVGQLHFKLAAVSDGKFEDMADAVQAAQTHSEVSAPSPMLQNTSQLVQTIDPTVHNAISFSDTLATILKSLESLQNLGDHLSEVSPNPCLLVKSMDGFRYIHMPN